MFLIAVKSLTSPPSIILLAVLTQVAHQLVSLVPYVDNHALHLTSPGLSQTAHNVTHCITGMLYEEIIL